MELYYKLTDIIWEKEESHLPKDIAFLPIDAKDTVDDTILEIYGQIPVKYTIKPLNPEDADKEAFMLLLAGCFK